MGTHFEESRSWLEEESFDFQPLRSSRSTSTLVSRNMSATKVKKHAHESNEPHTPSRGSKSTSKSRSPNFSLPVPLVRSVHPLSLLHVLTATFSIQFSPVAEENGTPKPTKSPSALAGSDLEMSDSVGSHHTPSRKKSHEGHGKSKASLILEKSPTLMKSLRDKPRFNSTSPKTDSPARTHAPTPSKSPSAMKLASKDESSDDEDALEAKLRAQDAAELENMKLASRAAMAVAETDSDSDNDAPVAKSFKESKKEAIDIHHGEQEDARNTAAQKKELRRQRTQLHQEQSKKSSKKQKEKESPRKKEAKESAMDVSDEESDELDLLPESLLKQAVSQSNTHIVMEQNEEDRSKIERRKQRILMREMEKQEKIDSKRVTVVPLVDTSGNSLLQSRKAAAQSAEAFLREHFWGGRLERTPAEHYFSERVRGPAHQFVVPGSAELLASQHKASIKERKKVESQKRKIGRN